MVLTGNWPYIAEKYLKILKKKQFREHVLETAVAISSIYQTKSWDFRD